MKTKSDSIKRNFIMNAILRMSSLIFPLITFPYISRILGPDGTGKVAFATSVVSYFNLFAQLGIPTYGVRTCARVRDNHTALTRTAQEILFINLSSSILSYFALFASIAFIPRLREERMLYLIVSATILLSTIGMEWLYKALEQYAYITVRSIVFKFVALLLMFLLVHRESDYTLYGGISIFAASASNILNFLHIRRYIDLRPVGGYQFQKHLKPVLVFFSMSCATTIYTHLDMVMLGFMTTDIDVGYYHASVRIKSILVSIITSLGTVLLPRVSYYLGQGREEEFRRISKKALRFVYLMASPMALYFLCFARQGIFFLSGNAFSGAVLPMRIIMPTLLFIGITNIFGIQILLPLGKEKIVLYSEIAGAVVDLILNALLIPRFRSAGAATGTLTAEMVVLLVQAWAIREIMPDIFQLAIWKKILPALGTASAASLWIPLLSLGNFLTLLLSAILFFGTYGGCLLIFKEKLF